MNTDNARSVPMAVVPRPPRSAIVLGEDSILGPKAGLELGVDEEASNAKLLATIRLAAESNAGRLLSGAADHAFQRAEGRPSSAIGWSQAGFAALAASDTARARESFERALSLDPTSRGALIGLARVEHESGAVGEAVLILRRLLGRSPDDLDVIANLAIVLAGDGELAEASKLLEREVAEAPQSAAFLAARGSVALIAGRPKEAVAALRKAVRLRPSWVHARNVLGIAEMRCGNSGAAERRFREAMRVGPLYEEPLLNWLRLLTSEKRFGEVLEAGDNYRQVLSGSPIGAGIAARAALALDEWRVARGWLTIALEQTTDPQRRARILNDLGVAFSRLGQHDEAGRKFGESVEQWPTELAIVNRGKAFLNCGEWLPAAHWLSSQNAGDEAPGPERAKMLGVALYRLRRIEEAVTVLAQLANERHGDEDVFGLLSAAHADNLDSVDEAIRFARNGLSLFPGSAVLLNNLAYALLLKGQLQAAEDALAQVATDKPWLSVACTATRGLLELKRGRIAEGRRLYEDALAQADSNALRDRVRVKRDLEVARALLVLGRQAEAVRLLERASKAHEWVFPYSEHAEQELRRLGSGGTALP